MPLRIAHLAHAYLTRVGTSLLPGVVTSLVNMWMCEKNKRTLRNVVLSVVTSSGFFNILFIWFGAKMKSLSNDFSSDLHLYKARTPQGHASGDPKPPLMITKDEDLLQEVFKTMLQPRGT